MTEATHAVVGLGNMGLAVARRLAMRGVPVVGVDIAEDRRLAFSILAGRAAVPSFDELDWSSLERVILLVRTEKQLLSTLDEVVSLAEGAGRSGLSVFVCTTVTPAVSKTFAKIVSPSVRILECPISGGEAPALMGAQTAMVAGPVLDADIAFLRENLMKHVVRFENYGEPALAKLLNNLLCAYNLAAFGQALEIAAQQGLDPSRFHQVVVTSSGSSFSARSAISILGDLLAKDVALAEAAVGPSPAVSPDEIEAQLERLCARMTSGS
jgi:3-hydroxyisobutyrate dehydrogenase-like beta-hydroxyacid dehydrogenase